MTDDKADQVRLKALNTALKDIRAGKDAKLVSTDGSGEKSFSIGTAKIGNNPDPAIGQTTAGKVRSNKKPNEKQTEKNVKQNRSFHYSSEG